MSVHDFEDMMRPLAKAALNQGWMILRSTNGHAKFVPPKGPVVTCSTTNAAYAPNLQRLRESGLLIPQGCLPAKKVEPKEEVAAAPISPPVTDPPVQEKRKQRRHGVVKNALMELLESKGEVGVHVKDITDALQVKVPGVSVDIINAACSQGAASGALVRVAKGTYRWHAPSAAKVLSKEETEMLAEDEAVLNEFMDALAKMQEWANKLRDKSIALSRAKKALAGL